jgi:hypothetical protein
VQLEKDPETQAIQEAKGQFRQARSKRLEVDALVARLATIRRENHFAELIENAVGGGE